MADNTPANFCEDEMAVQQNSLKYFGGKQSGFDPTDRQVVIERTDMSNPFSDDEYNRCRTAVTNGYAVAINWNHGGFGQVVRQLQLVTKRATGNLEFSYTRDDETHTWTVSGSSPHTISETSYEFDPAQFAPAQYGTDQVKNLPTSITAFRTGDVIPVDGPSGTAKMSKDDLLRVTAENALEFIKNDINISFSYTKNFIPNVDTTNKTIDLGGEFIIRTKGRYAAITSRSIPICDTSITSSVQMLVYSFDTSTFKNVIFSGAVGANEVVVGIVKFIDNVDFVFNKAWFPFEYRLDGVERFAPNTIKNDVNLSFSYTRNFIPNVDTTNKTIDLGGDFVIKSRGKWSAITSRSIPICDTNITSSNQFIVFSFDTGTFKNIKYNGSVGENEVIIGSIRLVDNVDFVFSKAWFPFDFKLDGVDIYDRMSSVENTEDIINRYTNEGKLVVSSLDDAAGTYAGQISYYFLLGVSNPDVKTAFFNNKGYDKVLLHTGHNNTNISAITFYKHGFGSSFPVGSVRSVNQSNHDYQANVPYGCDVIAISYRTDAWTDKFSFALVRSVATKNDCLNGALSTQAMDISTILTWHKASNNRIDGTLPNVVPNSKIKIKLASSPTIRFGLRQFNGTTLIKDSGWTYDELNTTLEGNVTDAYIRIGKLDDTDFTTEELSSATDNFTDIDYEVYRSEGLAIGEELIDKKINSVSGILKKIIRNVAHQGYSITSRYYGDNRLSSFTTLAENGFDFGECDVQWSSDGVPVCCHDASFTDQTTSQTIVIADHTLAELKTYDYYGETIATFEELLAECKKQGVGLYIDKQENYLDDSSKRAIIFGIVLKYEMEDDVVFVVSTQARAEILLAWYDKVSIGVVAINAINSGLIGLANDSYNGKNNVFIIANKDYNDVNAVITAKESLSIGVKIEVWTVDNVADYEAYFPYVNGIISNKLSQKIIAKSE